MARLVGLAVVVAAAGVAGWLLLGAGEDAHVSAVLPFADGGSPDGERAGAPRLEGVVGVAVDAEESAEGVPGEYRIQGLVRDAAERPAAGVRVVAERTGDAGWGEDRFNRDAGAPVRAEARRLQAGEPAPRGPAVEAVSDASGAFSITVDRSGTWSVSARPEPPRVGTSVTVTLTRGWARQSPTLWVLAGSAVKGRVVGGAGEGVAGALVQARWTDPEPERYRSVQAEARTAADGRFELAALPAGLVTFTVRPGGGASYGGYRARVPSASEIVLQLPEGGAVVEGLVHDPAGVGIAGAHVIVSGTDGSGAPDEASAAATRVEVAVTADATGRYRAAGLPDGKLSQVRAAAEGFLLLSWSARDEALRERALSAGTPLALDLPLRRGAVLEGRVLLAQPARGLEGAEVLLYPVAGGDAGRTPLLALSGPGGAYRVAGLGAGRWVILPRHPEYCDLEVPVQTTGGFVVADAAGGAPPARTLVVGPADETLTKDLLLGEGVRLSGRVVDETGAPVAGADVQGLGLGLQQVGWRWGIQPDDRREVLAHSDATGAFLTRALPPGAPLRLHARRDGRVGRVLEVAALTPGEPAEPVTLVLEPGATLRGRVLDEAGAGLIGAQVYAWTQTTTHAMGNPSAMTDAEGRFEITGVAPGDAQVQANLAGRMVPGAEVKGLAPGEVRDGIELRLAAGGTLTGRVRRSDGQPVAHVSLMLQVQQGNVANALQLRLDAKGRFRLAGVPGGATCTLMALSGGRAWKHVGTPFVAGPEPVELVYDPPTKVRVRGRVLDAAGEPVPLCRVEITAAGERSASNEWYMGGDTQECVNGTFDREVEGPAPYKVRVSLARDRSGAPLNLCCAEVTVRDPAQPVDVRLEGGRRARGRVLDEGGAPVAGVSLSGPGVAAHSGADGTFVLEGLPPGPVSFGVRAPPEFVAPGPATLGAGAEELTVRLVRGLSVRGTVLRPDGTPATNGSVSANWDAGGRGGGHAWARIEADGRFHVQALPPETRVDLHAQLWEAGRQAGRGVVKGVPAGSEDVVIRLAVGASIRGRVLDADGAPAFGHQVVAQGPDGAWVGASNTDAAGAFEIAGLEPGEWKVHARPARGGPPSPSVTVSAPGADVELRMPRTAAVAGRLRSAAGDLAGFNCHAWREGASGPQGGRAISGEDGRFRLEQIPAEGRWRIAAWRSGDRRYGLSEPFDGGDPPQDLAVRLVEGQTISGRVLGPPGTETGTLRVSLGAATWQVTTQTDAEGRFESPGLPPGGAYEIKVYSKGMTHAPVTNVAPGRTDVDIRLTPLE